MTLQRAFVDFLKTVDLPKIRDDDFCVKAATAFHKNEVCFSYVGLRSHTCSARTQMYDLEDIMGANVDKCKNVPSEGCASFMKRAVDKADAIYRKAGRSLVGVCMF